MPRLTEVVSKTQMKTSFKTLGDNDGNLEEVLLTVNSYIILT